MGRITDVVFLVPAVCRISPEMGIHIRRKVLILFFQADRTLNVPHGAGCTGRLFPGTDRLPVMRMIFAVDECCQGDILIRHHIALRQDTAVLQPADGHSLCQVHIQKFQNLSHDFPGRFDYTVSRFPGHSPVVKFYTEQYQIAVRHYILFHDIISIRRTVPPDELLVRIRRFFKRTRFQDIFACLNFCRFSFPVIVPGDSVLFRFIVRVKHQITVRHLFILLSIFIGPVEKIISFLCAFIRRHDLFPGF